MHDLSSTMIRHARHLARGCQVSVGVFEYAGRAFLPPASVDFCAHCDLFRTGQCDFLNTHLYGCFEADRWGGLYIYYCPLTLGFIASAVYAEGRAEYAMVTGPIVIGSLADTLEEPMEGMQEAITALPCRTAEDTTALSRLQDSLCAFLSGRTASEAEAARQARTSLHNTLYTVTEAHGEGSFGYPLALEKQLQKMIIKGDRQGARELINQLLGQLYFSEDGNFSRIRENAKALLVLFSRAAIDGGADAQQIFGDTRSMFDNLESCRTLDDLSLFLTSMFNRFVGYVFDFGRIRHADIVQKVTAYIRANYARRITLDDLASHVYLSRPYLSRILSEALGMPFTDYLNTYRVERSRELLETTALPLAEIAQQAGFSDQSYYTKVFRRHLGISPGEYRRAHEARG